MNDAPLRRAAAALPAFAALTVLLLAPVSALAVVADGNPFDWVHDHVKALDARGDMYYWGDGKDASRDLIAFYYSEDGEHLNFRIDLYDLQYGAESDTAYYIAMDFAPGGQRWLPDMTDCLSDLGDGWDLCIAVYDPMNHNVFFPDFHTENSLFAGSYYSDEHDMIEVSVKKPWTFPWGGTVRFQVFSTRDWTDGGGGEIYGKPDICDAFVDDDRGWGDGWLNGSFSSNDRVGSAKVAFVQHGNQGLTYTDVFRGRWGAQGGSGFDETLRAHDTYDVKANLHVSGTLLSAARWHDPVWVDWLRKGAHEGRFGIMASAWAQHIMPFVTDDMNDWALGRHRELIWHLLEYDPKVAWVPERVWDYPGGSSVVDWIGDNFPRQGLNAVILDDVVHGRALWNTYKIHQIENGPKVIFRSDAFSGAMHSGDLRTVRNMFMDFAQASDQEQVVVYADDWEMAAQTSDWQHVMPWALSAYWEACKYIGAHPWAQSVKLDELISWGWGAPVIHVDAGAHPSIGGTGGYGGSGGQYGRNAWYGHWAGFVHPSFANHKNYGTLWNDAHWAVLNCPDNALRGAAWFVLMTNLFETAWHDGLGGPISGWEHKYSVHIKNTHVYAEGAKWAGDPARRTEAFLWDMDNDGHNELVMRNDKLMAVFEEDGARAQWIFDSAANVVVGADVVYYPDTEGDYNDTNHIAALSDTWDGVADHQHQRYHIQIDDGQATQANGNTVQVTMTSGTITRVVRLTQGDPFLDVRYSNPQGVVHSKTGFSPGMVDLIYNGDTLERLWEARGAYAGFRNPRTGTVGALVMGQGGARHAASGESTLMKWDEVWGQGSFRFLLYAGPGTAADLDRLAAGVR